MPKALTFKDGTFKILHMTDFHIRNGDEKDRRTCALVKKLIESETPDLIVIGGDLIHKIETSHPLAAFEEALAPVAQSGIPWTFIFGNHELQSGVDPAKFIAILRKMPNSLFQTGPSHVQGQSNYILKIKASKKAKPAALLYLFDDGTKMTYPNGGKHWIHRSQISWYINNSARFTKRNTCTPLPALAFLHVPLPEYKEIWDYYPCYGDCGKGKISPQINSGLFAAMLEMGDVMGVFAGHSHRNDFYGDLYGIRLAHSRITGYGKAEDDYPRGARIIRLYEGERNFDTWQLLDDGSVLLDPPKHLPTYKDSKQTALPQHIGTTELNG